MLIFENIALAINGLWSNKMRALLTMLGIIIGIGSVIAIVTVGNSMTRGLQEEMQSFGASNITVYLTQKPQEPEEGEMDGGGGGMMIGGGMSFVSTSVWYAPEEKDYISEEMITKYREAFPDKVQYVSANLYLPGNEAKAGKATSKISTIGANVDYMLSANLNLLTGRSLNAKDMEERRYTAVVADLLCKELFGSEDPIGKTIEIKMDGDSKTFYIVGVYEQKQAAGMFSMGGAVQTTVYIPFNLAKSITNAPEGYQELTVTSTVGTDANVFTEETNAFFDKLYAKNKNFHAQSYSMQGMVDDMQSMLQTISTAISAIAAISLLVGGIGVMNIMLVSITERTREIGTRKALGATNGSIRIQFIVESMIICLIGGIIGIGVGIGLGSVGAKLVGYTARPELSIILIAVSFSMAIGVFFGYYPANKAAKLDPIEALRYE